jgi:GT2 family glycosyltransferase
MKVSASLVLFNNPVLMIYRAVDCFLKSGANGPLVIIDNSSEPILKELLNSELIIYKHGGGNIGFGAGHNLALSIIGGSSDIHLLMNPDVSFDPGVVQHIHNVMIENTHIGAAMPQVVYPDGSLQQLCKLLPTPLDLIFRRFIPIQAVRDTLNARYELHCLAQDKISFVPTLSGCFLFIRTTLLHQLGGFDTRYFMYMEDIDLVRRIGDLSLTAYVPSVKVMHEYSKGSYHQKKLLKYHIRSAIKYFFKWGWFFDPIRKKRNKETLVSIEGRGK